MIGKCKKKSHITIYYLLIFFFLSTSKLNTRFDQFFKFNANFFVYIDRISTLLYLSTLA